MEKIRKRDFSIVRCFYPRTGCQGRTRFIKSDVPVRTDTAQEQINTACRFYTVFVVLTLFLQIGRISIQGIDRDKLLFDLVKVISIDLNLPIDGISITVHIHPY